MNLNRAWIGIVTVGCSGLLGTLALSQTHVSNTPSQRKDRAQIMMSRALPALEGDHLKAVLVEVRYGPGEASPPHSHPCAVIGYVVEGSLRSEVQGEPETIYSAGQSFYEAPNAVHIVSANPVLRNRQSFSRISSVIVIQRSPLMCQHVTASKEHHGEP
jgi:quercetin dioxygenase-like cupin family protein